MSCRDSQNLHFKGMQRKHSLIQAQRVLGSIMRPQGSAGCPSRHLAWMGKRYSIPLSRLRSCWRGVEGGGAKGKKTHGTINGNWLPGARSKQANLLDCVSMAIGVDLRGVKFPFSGMLLIIQNSVVGKWTKLPSWELLKLQQTLQLSLPWALGATSLFPRR